ncbi:MAG: sensor histidine kinase [Planctomycetota bacterium]
MADTRASARLDFSPDADGSGCEPSAASSILYQQERLASLRELAYGASHEINNPLANIATRAQGLLRDEADPERRRSLATIAAQALRAHEMIADLMLFAKPPKLRPAWNSLGEILQATVQQLVAAFPHHPLSLQRLPAPDPALRSTTSDATDNGTTSNTSEPSHDSVWADRDQLLVALSALGRNALEAIEFARSNAASRPGQVTFTYGESVAGADSKTDGWEIRVRDNGPGISAAIAERIFDPFFSGREAGRGIGFGLPKAWRIIASHNGCLQLCAESAQLPAGQGSEFLVWLPKSPSPVA